MKALVFTIIALYLIFCLCMWYVVTHGRQTEEHEADYVGHLDVATGSSVDVSKKKFSRLTSKSPAIDVFDYIYTKFYRKNK